MNGITLIKPDRHFCESELGAGRPPQICPAMQTSHPPTKLGRLIDWNTLAGLTLMVTRYAIIGGTGVVDDHAQASLVETFAGGGTLSTHVSMVLIERIETASRKLP